MGCLDVNEAPISKLYVIDTTNKVCAIRQIADKSTLASRQIDEKPLEFCNGVIGLSSEEFLALRTYMKGN